MATDNKLFKTQIQRIALLILPYPAIVTLMSIDRIYDSTQKLSLVFCFYFLATIFTAALAFSNLGEKMKSHLSEISKRRLG